MKYSTALLMYSSILRFAGICMLLLCSSTIIMSQGNGADGALVVSSGTTTINTTATGLTGANAIGTVINVASSTGFAVGNQVLVMQMLGTNAGRYDRLTISALTATSVTFSSSTGYAYSSVAPNKAQLVKIPQYTSVSVSAGATLTAPAWNGTTGGVLIFYSNTTTTIDGTVTMNATGFAGGAGGAGGTGGTMPGLIPMGGQTAGAMGGSPTPTLTMANGGNGGGMGAGKGGTGGAIPLGFAPVGSIGTIGAGVSPAANPSSGTGLLVMGGGGTGGTGGGAGAPGAYGGGGGAASFIAAPLGRGMGGNNGGAGGNGAVGAAGGTGGGIVLLYVNNFSGSGTVTARGGVGSNATGTGGNGGPGGMGGQGGGAATNGTSPVHGGGGGGGGQGGQGGTGPSGGQGGAAGVIVINTATNAWAGTLTSTPGTGGSAGLGGAAGAVGMGGMGGMNTNFGFNGMAGMMGVPGFQGPIGTFGATGGTSQAPIITGTALPVELLSFVARKENDQIVLSWIIVSETGNDIFILEKSTDNKNFTTFFTTKGNGNTSQLQTYEAVDSIPIRADHYYRLKQIDTDGRTTVLNTILVKYLKEDLSFLVYPNPVGETRTIAISGNPMKGLSLYSHFGELIWQKKNIVNERWIKVELPSDLSSGLYYLSIETELENYKTRLFIP